MRPRRTLLPLFIPHAGCPHDCVFCSQRRISGQMQPVTPAEVAHTLEALREPVEELAFYGGSFTALPLAEQEALLDAARPQLRDGTVGSIRISTRPDAVDETVLALLKNKGVATVELGAQSMDDAVLRLSGRGHTASDTVEAAEKIKAAGLRLGLQMMTGLPGSTDALDEMTARRLIALGPAEARIYPTVILRDTPLYALWQTGEYREHTVEDAVRVCACLLPLFDAAGIPVIRLGLNSTESLSAGDAAGGAYHPALGELVRSRVLLERARELLREQTSRPGAAVTLGVNPSKVSQMIGQHRCNLRALEKEFFQYSGFRVRGMELPAAEIRIIFT